MQEEDSEGLPDWFEKWWGIFQEGIGRIISLLIIFIPLTLAIL
jgi:hypothetical protein